MSLDVSKLHAINRDYVSIYNNLKDIVPELTTQWSMNDESDPGVVLVKLMSMIGDMLSYNTDKAYLEAFPDTVTQRKNAYQIFKLVGYKMHWYRSATCECYFNNPADLKGNPEIIYIPRYTQIRSNDGTICYTNPTEDLNIVKGVDGEFDPRQQTTLVEGIPITPDIYADSIANFGEDKTYIFNGNTAWHSVYKYNVTSDVIIDNRIYFNNSNIEEKYITLIDDSGVTWQMVENIDTADNLNERIFEFDVDEFNQPYIKLIDYWQDLNISKFKLFYILSSGAGGTIAKNKLRLIGGDAYTILNTNSPNIEIYNSDSKGGLNPDSPSVARRESAKYINTFDTLVTLDDFTKFVKRYEITGNAVSKDYTNDFNSKVLQSFTDINSMVMEMVNGISNFNDYIISLIVDIGDIPTFLDSIGYSVDLMAGTLVRSEDKVLSKSLSTLFSTILVDSRLSWVTTAFDKFLTSFNTKYENIKYDVIGENYIAEATYDFFVIMALSLVDYDTTNEFDTTPYIDVIINSYDTDYDRLFSKDLLQSIATDDTVSGNVNIYITPSRNYTIADYSTYKDEIEEDIYSSKIMPLSVNTTVNGIDYYKWTVGANVYLKSPVSYNKAQEILVNIDNALKYIYAPENIGYNNAVRQIDVVNNVMNVDKNIQYVDIDKITYQNYDMVADKKYGDIFTDKNIITGDKYVTDMPFEDVFTQNSDGTGMHFEFNFLDGVKFESDESDGGEDSVSNRSISTRSATTDSDTNYRSLIMELVDKSGVRGKVYYDKYDNEITGEMVLLQYSLMPFDEMVEDMSSQYEFDFLNNTIHKNFPPEMTLGFLGEDVMGLLTIDILNEYLKILGVTFEDIENEPIGSSINASITLDMYVILVLALVSMPGEYEETESPDEYEKFKPYSDVFANYYNTTYSRNLAEDLGGGGGGGESTHGNIISLDDSKYLHDYTLQQAQQGNILIRPNSFCVTFENGDYIVKDNGYGSLVCNENILDMSSIEYKITDGHMVAKFDVNYNINLDESSKVSIKFARNNITMALYDGLNPSLFTIDSESIEV